MSEREEVKECSCFSCENVETVIAALRSQLAAARELSPVDREQMREVVKLAHEVGWNGVENSKILSVFLRDYLTTAERERDEARRERDREKMERAAMEMVADDTVSERDKFASMLHDCENERDGWKHRAERAERDAERYRYLRALLRHAKWRDVDPIHELAPEYEKYVNDADLDASLDAQIKHARSLNEPEHTP